MHATDSNTHSDNRFLTPHITNNHQVKLNDKPAWRPARPQRDPETPSPRITRESATSGSGRLTRSARVTSPVETNTSYRDIATMEDRANAVKQLQNSFALGASRDRVTREVRWRTREHVTVRVHRHHRHHHHYRRHHHHCNRHRRRYFCTHCLLVRVYKTDPGLLRTR